VEFAPDLRGAGKTEKRLPFWGLSQVQTPTLSVGHTSKSNRRIRQENTFKRDFNNHLGGGKWENKL
jgi:hypothetical protein